MRTALLAVASFLAALALACSGSSAGSGPGSGVTITGKVAAPPVAPSSALSRRALAGTANRLVAFRVENGLIFSGAMATVRTADLGADGSFAITLPDGSDWMLILEDTSQTGPARFTGYVAATVGAGNTLLALPTSGAAGGGTIALGTVSPPPPPPPGEEPDPDADTYSSSQTVTASDFSLSPAALAAIARADGALKNVKNLYRNAQGNTFAQITTSFAFDVTGVAENAFPSPSAYALEPVWHVQVDTNHPGISLDLLCGDSPPLLELYDPVDTTGPVRDSADATCTGTAPNRNAAGAEIQVGEKSEPDPFGSRATLSFAGFSGAIPAGDWRLTTGGATAALFDAVVATPDDGAGRPTGIVPTVMAVTDSSHRVTRFDVKWYSPDGAGGYAEITDPATFVHLLRTVELKVSGFPEQRHESFMFDPSLASSMAPTQEWYVSGGDASLHADRVSVYVGNGGVGRAFITSFQ